MLPVVAFVSLSFASDLPPLSDGRAVIHGRAGESAIVITTTARVAGAIHSLTWGGKEFIDSFDHGRQLQSAANFDLGTPITAETFNPTEAGARRDGSGQRSSSRLLHMVAAGNTLQTTTQMAFWLAPGERSGGNPAKNTTVVSNHLVTKRVQIGYKNLPHVIDYRVTFSVPVGERHTHAVFEALTGYMPAEFERFWKFNPQSGELAALDDGPGEQAWPVVLATAPGGHAMGVYSPDQPSRGFEGAGYGRWRFGPERVVKWNCVFRSSSPPEAIAAGEYTYRLFVIVGDLATVRDSLGELHRKFRRD